MESMQEFKELEEYALAHTRFNATSDSEDDFIEQYVKALNKRGYYEGDCLMSIWTTSIALSRR